MPSFWSWLCFPRKGYRARSGQFRSPRTDAVEGDNSGLENSYPANKRKHKGNLHVHGDHIRVQNHTHTLEPEVTAHPVDSGQRLVDDHVTNKRRRVQDIFNLNEDDTHFDELDNVSYLWQSGYPKNSNDFTNKNLTNIRYHSDFGSEYTPKGFQQQRLDNYHVVSMYRYVPKVVQNVYASKALEGGKVDDYFAHLHRENSMTSFANAKMANRKIDNVPSLPCQDVYSNFSVTTPDKISLIEKDENENVEEPSNELELPTQMNISTRTESILEASFDSMWNSNGEVLY